MKHILVSFYPTNNLGDDLFIHILAEQFPDCKIDLMSSIRHAPRHLRSNVRIHPFSYFLALNSQLQKIIKKYPPLSQKFWQFEKRYRRELIQNSDAYLNIGGSLFMDRGDPEEEIHFPANKRPAYDYISAPQNNGNSFLIGANLGPVFHESYWTNIRETFQAYNHVCLRDYASYRMLQDLPHVQYAPDVIFMAHQPEPEKIGENVVISVIDIGLRTKDHAVIDAYYSLLRDTILRFNSQNIPVTLVSFCKMEGDEDAIAHLMDMLPDHANVSTCFYDGNIQKLLSLMSNATYIVASRFHAMILALSFGKPVFPISYNCKIKHYLDDVDFQGKYAVLQQLPEITADDLLYNYEHRIITDCSLHKKYAPNQFRALREFLGQQK